MYTIKLLKYNTPICQDVCKGEIQLIIIPIAIALPSLIIEEQKRKVPTPIQEAKKDLIPSQEDKRDLNDKKSAKDC